jgi:hypothetical protein
MRYFFLSYAHGQHDDLVKAFFTDLSGEVREHAGRDRDYEVGFRDHHDVNMDRWSPDLVNALQTAQTFIALCSPGYFRSASCGREWWVFAQRLALLRRDGLPPPALIPLFWLPTEIPAHLTDLQYSDPSFGTAYEQHGLRRLLQLGRLRDDYLEFVTAVAVRVTATAEQHTPPPLVPTPTFASAADAFAAEVPALRSPTPVRRRSPAKLPLLTYEENRDDDDYR